MKTLQQLKSKIRDLNASYVSIFLILTNRRFDKTWRWEETKFKAFIFNHLLNTIKANRIADKLREENDFTKAI